MTTTNTQVTPGAWRAIKDFMWLKTTPSPNWSELAGEAYSTAVPERAAAEAEKLGLTLLPF